MPNIFDALSKPSIIKNIIQTEHGHVGERRPECRE